MLTEIVLILFCVATFWVNYRIVNRDKFKLVENLDDMGKTYPIIGGLSQFFGKSADENIQQFCELASKCTNSCKFWIFTKIIVVMNTPQDVQTVLNSPHCLEKAIAYKALGSSSGLIASHPTSWKPHRRLLNTSFNLQTTLKLIPSINEMSRNLVKNFEPLCNQGEIPVLDIIGVDITNNALYSLLDYNFDKKTTEFCYDTMNKVMDLLGERMLKFYINIAYGYIEKILHIQSKPERLSYHLLDQMKQAFITGKQKYMNTIEKDAIKIATEEQLRNRPDGFLKRLYRMVYHNRLKEQEMAETIVTLLYAGADTTTRMIGNIILSLAMHPEIQDKLYVELQQTIGDNEEIDIETILKAEYLDRVIKETFRLLKIVPVIGRRAAKDIQIENGVIPAGADIIIPISNIHTDKRIWGENADKFDPDNFLPENCQKRHRCSFIPFSYGPRNCIGYRYAQLTLKITVAHLVRKYKFESKLRPADLVYGFGMTAKLRNDYNISIVKR